LALEIRIDAVIKGLLKSSASAKGIPTRSPALRYPRQTLESASLLLARRLKARVRQNTPALRGPPALLASRGQ